VIEFLPRRFYLTFGPTLGSERQADCLSTGVSFKTFQNTSENALERSIMSHLAGLQQNEIYTCRVALLFDLTAV
jgi:hypothetical protein